MTSVEDFITVRMDSLSFLSENIVHGNSIIEVEEDRNPLDWDRLRDANDDYDEILFDPNRVIDVRDWSNFQTNLL